MDVAGKSIGKGFQGLLLLLYLAVSLRGQTEFINEPLTQGSQTS